MYPQSYKAPIVAAPDWPQAQPLLYGIDTRADIAFTAMPAKEIARALESNACDCGLVSPTLLLSNPSLRVIPGAGLATRTSSPSHGLVSEGPLENIRQVRVDPEAADLIPYVEVVFAERGIPRPEFVVRVDDAQASACASLIVTRNATSRTANSHDLGALWRDTTGLPLVLGVWACTDKAPYRSLRQTLGDAAKRGEEAARINGGMPDDGTYYYRLLSAESDSLRLLHTLARRHAIAGASVESIAFC